MIFQSDTLFCSKLEGKAVDTMDLGDTTIELVLSDNLQEKFNKLNVEAELQVSLLAGLIKLSGSGSYLGEEKKSARTQSMSLIYKLRTVNEEVMLRQNKDKIDIEMLKSPNVNGTHVVVAIDWGAVCSVTCEYENKADKDVTEVKGALKAEIEKLKGLVDVKGSTKASYEDKNKDNHKQFTFRCKADVSAPDKDLPVTFEGAVELARSLPSLVKGANEGKGVPLLYMLMPLDAVIKMCRLQIALQIQYTTIDEDIIKKCAQIAEGITKKRQALYDIQSDLNESAEYVTDESLARIDDILEKFIVQESRFKARLQDVIKKVRSGRGDVSEIDEFLSKELSETFSISRYNDQIRGFQKDLKKVKSIKSWKKKGIIYIGKTDELIVDSDKKFYIFYKSSDENEKDEFDEKNRDFFLRLQTTHANDDNYKFIVVDQDLRKDLWQAGGRKVGIHSFIDGMQVSTDLYAKEGQELEMCLIQLPNPTYQQTRPNNRAHVQLRCPNALSGNGLCTGDPVTWKCSKCKMVVEYGIDTKLLYCKCGQSNPSKSLWRCNEKDHGIHYVRYPDDILIAELSSLRAIKEKNILILGETGVGKSTWINGFINYLYFADMAEAMNAKEFHVLIPSSFTFTQRGEGKTIKIGEADANETMVPGKSATKEPRSYVFHVGGEIVRLIDTPGIGDSEGIKQDRKNFDNILSYLTYYEEIHAVCILLKPNSSRLTVVFRFCIQELLAHLHSSAKHNIVFCFTNARATFYEPGDTLPALNKELRDKEVGIQATHHNYFCFDNEPFRFLACVKNGVEFSQGDINTYAESWNKSVEETMRLFHHISRLKPHKIRNTLNMNEARRIIVAMSKPLAQVAKTIQQNVQEGNEAKTQIDLVDKDMDSLKANLKFSGFDLKRVELGYPRTVCADSKCVKSVPIGATSQQKIIYKQICHSHCGLSGIPTETVNDARLQRCWCIRGTTCRHSECGHHYTAHMHMTYDLEEFPKEFLSPEVQAQINAKKSAKETKEAFKKAIDTKIEELKEEERIIMKTSAKYGSFLKANALIPYNDAVGDYLEMSIEQERNKVSAIRNDTLLATMEDMKRQYEHERRILDNAIGTDNDQNIHTPEEVKKLQDELFRLKHMGQTLKDLFSGISIAHSARNIAFEEKTAPTPQKSKKKTNKSWNFPSMPSLPSVSWPWSKTQEGQIV